MRGVRPKMSSEGLPPTPKVKKSLLEDEKFFSDEDDFDDIFYSEREKDYVKKFNKSWNHRITAPRQAPVRPLPQLRQDIEELTRSSESAKAESVPSSVSLISSISNKGSILSKELAISGISNAFKASIAHNKNRKMANGVEAEHFKSVLSLHLQKKGILQIMPDAFQYFGSLAHLYLNDNKIADMMGFSHLQQLESLHLSGNKIKRIQNLESSFNLRQLYLGQNEIEVIEGLDNLTMLVELHIEHQKLPPEQSLIFSPNSLDSISQKLKVLNAKGNQLESIEDLMCMNVLDTLIISQNNLTDLDGTNEVLKTLKQLRVLDLRENAILKDPKYKEKIIGVCGGIELLDGKDVNDIQKRTLQRLCAMKAMRARTQNKPTRSNPVRFTNSFPGAFHQIHLNQNMHRRSEMTTPSSIHDVHEPFAFSTPISMSPTPDKNKHYSARLATTSQDATHHEHADDTSISIQSGIEELYSARFQSEEETGPGTEDKMSEMAKIIFRLSNLSPEDIRIGKSSKSEQSSMNYWKNNKGFGDRFSSFKESRPLSPLEVDVTSSNSSGTIHMMGIGRRTARRPMTRKLPARSVGAGRTLSPLEELPTPDSTIHEHRKFLM